METKDSNGALLADGDSVTLIKDLKVKGSSLTLKRGTLVKNIRLTNSPAEIEGRASGSTMVLKTEFLKKA
ncbi:zinc ribbon domain-containing protein YjdM [Hymenobacter nivis]|uniref:Alkylphosphonate utilization protein n=1 Tax=Hymenobacter nivis TaxID=1850093 RepID=A0A502HBH3_9BACT|nr:zinc ribbon domain-containing protein YjdM [Hymenobacter nivis]TPG72099.1 alkylphosphonate utilization protein [Hymenobacter nivis]